MTRTRRGTRVAMAGLCALSLIAAACGDDDDGGETAATTAGGDAATTTSGGATTTGGGATTTGGGATTTTAGAATTSAGGATTTAGGPVAAPTGTPVKIGVLYAETGRTSSTYAFVDDVANAWAEWTNSQRGGVNGHPVEIVAGDDQSTGEGASAAVREMVENEGVVGVVIQDSAAEAATVEYLTQQGVPYIGGTANQRPIDGGGASWPNTHFVTAPSNPVTAANSVQAAKAIEKDQFSAAVCAEVPACAQAGQLFEGVATGVGIDYVGLVTVGAAEQSYTAPCLELIGLGANFINLGVTSATGIAIIEECQTQGYDGAFGAASNTVVEADFEGIDGLQLAGNINGFPWWADDPQVEDYRSALEQYAGDADGRNPSATSTWSALELFRTAITDYGPAAAAPITAADVVAAYHQVEGETLGGLLPAPVSFVESGPQPYLPCSWLFDMQDGEFSTITVGESGNGASGDLQTSCFRT